MLFLESLSWLGAAIASNKHKRGREKGWSGKEISRNSEVNKNWSIEDWFKIFSNRIICNIVEDDQTWFSIY